MTAEPRFPCSYPNADKGQTYETKGFNVTIAEQYARDSFARLNVETQRDFVGLQLCLFDLYGVFLGWGTGWRIQLANQPNHAEPGYSWHEGLPVASNANAFAIDTIGLNEDRAIDHDKVWSLMERHLPEFGFTSFKQPQSTNPEDWSQVPRPGQSHIGPYTGNWDRPHIQSRWLPVSRNRGGGRGPYTSTSQLPHWPLPHTDLPAKYDVDVVGRAPMSHPLWSGESQEDEFMTDDQAKAFGAQVSAAITAGFDKISKQLGDIDAHANEKSDRISAQLDGLDLNMTTRLDQINVALASDDDSGT